MSNDNGDTRYGNRSGSGANEPKRNEKKEQAPDWKPRQGGSESRSDPENERQSRVDPTRDKAQGKATRGHGEVATRRHLEGSEQGPS
jgi:hypothetical protein